MASGKCRSCGAAVEWFEMRGTGKSGIFDAAFKQGGTGYVMTSEGAMYVKDAPARDRVYTSHWSTCPNAKKHRAEADAKKGERLF